jgi:hypothetical protein
MTTWHAIGTEPVRNGVPGGDYEVTDAWNVRLRNDALPNAVVDVDYWVDRLHYGNPEVPSEPPEYGITGMIQFTICTGPDDPGGTETWGGIQYDNDADPLGYDDPDKADKAARFQAERWIAMADKFMIWDGRPFR